MLAMVSICSGCRGEAVAHSTENFAPGTGFTAHRLVVNGNVETVWVFLPKDYRPDKKYPTILFLHGLFERGKGGENCLSGGLGPVIAKNPEKWPFITIFPQSDGNWRGMEHDQLAMAALDFVSKRWSIDEDRVVLAGLSYGGLGTWEIGSRHADRFCALVPVSGHKATELIDRLILLPVWAFAYDGDPIVPAKGSEEMCQGFNQRGGKMRLTEFMGIGHDCWDLAVNDSDLVNWMLKQKRSPDAVAKIQKNNAANAAVADIK